MRAYLQQIKLRKQRKTKHYRPLMLSDDTPVSVHLAEKLLAGMVSNRTLYRWAKAKKVPPAYDQLLIMMMNGWMIPPTWQRAGIRFNQTDELEFNRMSVNKNQLELFTWQRQFLFRAEQENKKLQKQIVTLEAQLNIPQEG